MYHFFLGHPVIFTHSLGLSKNYTVYNFLHGISSMQKVVFLQYCLILFQE